MALAPIGWLMEPESLIDLEKLRADMAAHVERTSARKFSLAATGGRNPDFYRNFVNDGRDKRMSAEVFAGIVSAMERNPADYIRGLPLKMALPSAAVLTNTIAALLETVGIDPYEDERARKLARQFPDALRDVVALHGRLASDASSFPEEDSRDPSEGPTAP